MILPGEKRKLRIDRILSQGAYLAEDSKGSKGDEVLLPGKQVPEGAAPGDEIEVFIYRDSKDRLISTTSEPLIWLHQVARLQVREVTKIGAFLDMGLERDLLLPFAEQTYAVKEGSYVLVAMYRDKSNRLAATMKIYEYLSTDSPYSAGDEIEGLVYEISRNFGAFVAVDNKYSGLIPAREYEGEVKAGDFIRARVSSVKEDGKVILEYLEKNDGRIPFNDKADPELIRETFHMSKAAFKRAVGHLFKAGRIDIAEDSILSI